MNSYRFPRRKPEGVPKPARPKASTTPDGDWSIAWLMPDKPRKTSKKATVTATSEPDRSPSRTAIAHRPEGSSDEFDAGSAHVRSPYRSRKASSRSGSSTTRLATRCRARTARTGSPGPDRVAANRLPSTTGASNRERVQLGGVEGRRRTSFESLACPTGQFVDGSLSNHPAGPEDGDAIGSPLDLAQDVGREEHGRPGRRVPRRPWPGTRAAGRIETIRRLIEDQEVGPRREGQEQGDLASIAGREVSHRTVELDPQASAIDPTRLSSPPGADRPPRRAGERSSARAGGTRPGRTRSSAGCRRRRLWIQPEDLDRSARRPDQVEQASNGRALARAVGPDIPEDLAGPGPRGRSRGPPRPSQIA